MIEINLAPGAVHAGPARRRAALQLPSLPALGGSPAAVGAGAAALLALLVVGFAFWSQGVRERDLTTRIEREVTDSTRFASTIALVESLQARQDTIRQKIGIIREVDQRRYVWPHLMDEVSGAVPGFTWLSQIGSVEAPPPPPVPADSTAPVAAVPAGPNFTLQGHAGSTQALTRFMKNLEASRFIRDVVLVTSEQVDMDGRTLHRFTLEARYEAPDASMLTTVPIVTVE